MITINFIGCGKLGKTIAKLIAMNHVATIRGVMNATKESTLDAVNFIGQGTAIHDFERLPQADITFITTRDDNIKSICDQLINLNIVKPHSFIIHCSGSLSSDILANAKKAKCVIASVHPAKSFADPYTSIKTFHNTFCAFEGEEEAFSIIKTLFENMGGFVIRMNKEKKKQYHAASVMANNYLLTLHDQAMNHFVQSGIEENIACQLASTLMKNTLNNLIHLKHQSALTGPIQRGDIETIKGHIDILRDDPIAKNIYASLGLGTLSLTDHSLTIKNEFENVFKNSLSSIPHNCL